MDEFILPSEIIQMIHDGDLDDSLFAIKVALNHRQQIVSSNSARTMKAGDQFYIKDISPKYLSGITVEFIEYTSGVAPVRAKMIYPVRDYYAGKVLNLREGHVGRRV